MVPTGTWRPIAPLEDPCPGSPAWPHASFSLGVATRASCSDVRAEILARVGGQYGRWQDPQNNGTYTVIDAGLAPTEKKGEHKLSFKRVSRNRKVTDHLRIILTPVSGVNPQELQLWHDQLGVSQNYLFCAIRGCSERQSTSFFDSSANYCNLHNLYCGSDMGCLHVVHDFRVKEIETKGSLGAGSDVRRCVLGAAKSASDARAFAALGMQAERERAEKSAADAEAASEQLAAEAADDREAQKRVDALARLGITSSLSKSPPRIPPRGPSGGFSAEDVDRAVTMANGGDASKDSADDSAHTKSEGDAAWTDSFEAPECGWEGDGAAEDSTAGADATDEADAQGGRKARLKSKTLRKIFGRRASELPVQAGAVAGLATSEEAWFAEWRRQLSCWMLSLPSPSQEQLGSCIGALSLHLGGRLERMLGRSASAAAVETRSAEPGCEWLERAEEQLQLPELPQLGDFEFSLPPIPRLVPSADQLLVLQGSHIIKGAQAAHSGLQMHGSHQRDWAPLDLVGAGAGTAAGALVTVGMLLTWRAARHLKSDSSSTTGQSSRLGFIRARRSSGR